MPIGPPTCVLAGLLLAGAALLPGPARAGDTTAPRLEVRGTSLRVVTPAGPVVEAAELTGAVLAVAVGAETLRLRIAGVEHDPKNPDLLLYDLRIVEPGGAERPFCGPDPDGRRLGFPLAGRTDPTGALRPDATAFEMVCTAGAQGKCVRFGYRPWQGGADGRGLDRYNACVRAVRADYCGEGRSHTRDGTLIGLREPPGSEAKAADDVPADFRFEAAWGPHGALCVAHTRQPDLLGLDELARTCPRLAADLGPERCTPDRAGALILNESR